MVITKQVLKRALKWSFLAELASKAVQPLVFIVLARLLTPQDFGIMAAALMVAGLSQVLWEAGMGKALVQRQDQLDAAANSAFWINLGLGAAIAIALLLGAEAIAAQVFRDLRVTGVLWAMTPFVLLGALCSVPNALLQRQMEFRQLFWVRFTTVALPGLASIPLAWGGLGYWALVCGSLIGQAAQTLLLWHLCGWRPSAAFDRRVAAEMARFGGWVALSGLLAWFYAWADGLIVGIYLGSHELGIYRTGGQIAALLFSLGFSPVAPVLYSYLARGCGDPGETARIAETVVRILTATAIPLAFVMFALAEAFEAALFAERWHGIATVIGLLALMQGYSWVVGMNGEFYRAMGRPSLEAIVTGASMAVYLAAYLVSIRFGFETFVQSRLGLALGALVLHLIILRAVLPVRLPAIAWQLLRLTAIALAVTTAVDLLVDLGPDNPWWRLAAGAVLNLGGLALAIFLLERRGIVRDLREMLRSVPA